MGDLRYALAALDLPQFAFGKIEMGNQLATAGVISPDINIAACLRLYSNIILDIVIALLLGMDLCVRSIGFAKAVSKFGGSTDFGYICFCMADLRQFCAAAN